VLLSFSAATNEAAEAAIQARRAEAALVILPGVLQVGL